MAAMNDIRFAAFRQLLFFWLIKLPSGFDGGGGSGVEWSATDRAAFLSFLFIMNIFYHDSCILHNLSLSKYK